MPRQLVLKYLSSKTNFIINQTLFTLLKERCAVMTPSIAHISDRMFSLRSWAEHVAASLQISMCFPFAFPSVFQVPVTWVVLPSSNDDAFGILQPMWYYDFKISVYCIWRPFEWHSYSTKVAFQHKNAQNLTPFSSACLCYCCKAVSWASPLSTAGNYPDT